MSQINRPPIALQSLLGSQNFGQNPNDLAQQVRPTIDLFPFWASQTLKLVQETAITAGIGSLVELVVPDGKTWGILSAAFTVEVSDPNDNLGLMIALDESLTGTVEYVVAASPLATGSLSDIREFAAVWNPNHIFWLPPGYVIRGINTGENISSTYRLDSVLYELDI